MHLRNLPFCLPKTLMKMAAFENMLDLASVPWRFWPDCLMVKAKERLWLSSCYFGSLFPYCSSFWAHELMMFKALTCASLSLSRDSIEIKQLELMIPRGRHYFWDHCAYLAHDFLDKNTRIDEKNKSVLSLLSSYRF